jgi:hypothetical protein
MSCEEIRDSLVARLDGELDRRTAAAVDEHLAGCGACARELASLRSVVGAVSEVLGRDRAGASMDAFDRVWARVAAGEAVPAPAAAPEQRSGRISAGLGVRPPHGDPHRDRDAGVRSGRVARGRERVQSQARRSGLRLTVIGGAVAAAGLALVVALAGNPFSPGAGSGERSAATKVAESSAPAADASRERRDPSAVAQAKDSAPAAQPKVAARPSGADAAGGGNVRVAADSSPPESSGRDLQVPDELRKHPGMFLDLPIVQQLEKLRHMEAVYDDGSDGQSSG